MKKNQKKSVSIFDRKVTITIDESLDEVKLSPSMQKKLDEANEHLKKMKMPDSYYNKHPQ